MKRLCLIAVVVVFSACGRPQVNQCVTRGATYLASFVELSGSCGPLTTEVVNVNSDGTISTSAQVPCAGEEDTGCTTKKTDCRFSSGGYNFSTTSEITFASDGSSATGLATIAVTGAGSCASTYRVTYARQ